MFGAAPPGPSGWRWPTGLSLHGHESLGLATHASMLPHLQPFVNPQRLTHSLLGHEASKATHYRPPGLLLNGGFPRREDPHPQEPPLIRGDYLESTGSFDRHVYVVLNSQSRTYSHLNDGICHRRIGCPMAISHPVAEIRIPV